MHKSVNAGRMSNTKLFILFALALPAFVMADNVKNKTNCINDNENVMNSVHPVVMCFSQILQEQISTNTSSEGCHTAEDFNKTFENFRYGVIESCIPEKDRQPFINRQKYLYDLIAFSLNNNTFKDFYENNGMECVQRIKLDLATCVKDNAGFNMTKVEKLNPRYWLKLNIPIYTHSSCKTTRNIRMCAEEQLVKNNCTEPNAKYITGLFDHLLKKCETIKPNTEGNWAPQLATSPLAIIGTMMMLLFI